MRYACCLFPVGWALQQGEAGELVLLCTTVQLVSLGRLKTEPPHVWPILHQFPVLECPCRHVGCSEVNLVGTPVAFLCMVYIRRWEGVELASHTSCLCLGGIDLSTEGGARYFGQKGLN